MTDCVEERFAQAAALVRQRQHRAAIAAYTLLLDATIKEGDAGVERDTCIRALSNRSACHASLEEYSEALADAQEVVRLSPRGAKGFGRLATAYHGLKHYEEAVQAYERAAALDPANVTYREQLAAVRELLAQRRGIASEATRREFYYKKSLASGAEAMKAGCFFDAIRHFGKALECIPEPAIPVVEERQPLVGPSDRAVLLCNRSAAFFKVGGRLTESLADAQEAMEDSPEYARAYFRAALALQQLNRIPEAYDMAATCTTLDPQHAEGTALLASLTETIDELKKTSVEKQRDALHRAEEIREKQLEEAATARAAASAIRSHGPAHATSYTHCSYCNEVGHTRGNCPFRMKKRLRE